MNEPRGPLLTVAIPTYDRRAVVVPTCEGLVPAVAEGRIELLVIDDGSHDGTHEALVAHAEPGFRALRHDVNEGYAATFLHLFDEVRTRYVLVSADDDRMDLSALPQLEDWLAAHDVDFVSSQWRTAAGDLYRGRGSASAIEPGDLRAASSHAPGLVYATDATRAVIPRLREALEAGSEAVAAYPQVGLAAVAIARRRASWWDGCLVSEGAALATGIVDGAQRRYSHPAARLNQHLAFDALLAGLEDDLQLADERGRMRSMRRDNARSIYASVREVVEATTGPTGARLVDRATARNLLVTSFRRLRDRISRP